MNADFLRATLAYDPKTGIFRRIPSGTIAGSTAGRYVRISVGGKIYLAHRLAWLHITGFWPREQIDHIDGNQRNNSFHNLREATAGQNRVNAPAYGHSKTSVRGVHLHACGRYRVQLFKDGKSHHGGYFDSLSDAENAARSLALRLHGEFACPDSHRPTTRSVAIPFRSLS